MEDYTKNDGAEIEVSYEAKDETPELDLQWPQNSVRLVFGNKVYLLTNITAEDYEYLTRLHTLWIDAGYPALGSVLQIKQMVRAFQQGIIQPGWEDFSRDLYDRLYKSASEARQVGKLSREKLKQMQAEQAIATEKAAKELAERLKERVAEAEALRASVLEHAEEAGRELS